MLVLQKRKPHRQNSYSGAQGSAKDHGKLNRRHSSTHDNGKVEDKKITKIPVSRFRQTVEKVQEERRGRKLKEQESHIPIRRSSIPKQTSKAPTKPVRKSISVIKMEVGPASVDEFDKLYEQAVHSPTPINIDVSLLNPKVDDPEKLESKFEEIIHDYDENRVQPIDVERIKKSKIPFLKRRSQQDSDVHGRSDKIIAARDKLRMRYSAEINDVKVEEALDNHNLNELKTDENAKESDRSDQNDVKLQTVNITVDENNVRIEELVNNTTVNTEENYPVTTMKTTKTKTVVATSSKNNEETEFTKVVGRTTVTEVITSESSIKIENTEGQITEENIQKDFIKIGIPVFESYVHEIHTDNIEKQKTVEVKNLLTYTPNNEDIYLNKFERNVEIIEINNDNEPCNEIVNNFEQSIIETVETCETPFKREIPEVLNEIQKEMEDTKAVIKEKDSSSTEDLVKLRGKVGKLLNKKDSHEPLEDKIDFRNELAGKKSVLSKIAMFERHEPEPVTKPKIPKKDIKLPKLFNCNKQRADNVHVHTPLIVDEIFKPFEAKTDTNITVKKVEITTNGNEGHVRAEMVVIESPETMLYNAEAKVQIESNAFFIEQSKVTEEVLTPVLKKEPKFEVANDMNKKWNLIQNKPETIDASVIVPKFVPVREVLKRYESITSDAHVNKSVESLPKIKPISEIISELKPDANHRPLDAMFAHQSIPANDILNDLKAEHKNEKEFVTQYSNNENDDDVFHSNEKPRHGLKSFKSRDYEYKTIESENVNFKSLQYIQDYHNSKVKNDDLKRNKSHAELDLGNAVKGKVNKMIVRINSVDKLLDNGTKDTPISLKEMPRTRSVSEKIALFERKLVVTKEVQPPRHLKHDAAAQSQAEEVTADIQTKIAELSAAKLKYGKMDMSRVTLANGVGMPSLAVGTALLDPRLAFYIVCAAIDLGYRAIDTAHIYGNEKVIGEAIKAKINDGTVTREELFVISKLWSTYHRTDLVKVACEASLAAMGLDYFDLYLIHNPMSFKEGGAPIPKIATVLQYSEYEYLDAWFGMETLGRRARTLGVSNFNSTQIKRVLDRARVKPVVNQVECHPYLSQQRLDDFCSERNITLSCFGVLGSKGTPVEYKSGNQAAIDDALVQVMASGLNVSPAQLLIRYQLECGHQVVVKASCAAHLWDNLQALTFNLTSGQVDALHALNRNKRTFTFKGMGDTHKNYPFNAPF